MPFQKFSRDKPALRGGEPWISIQVNGSVSISADAVNLIGNPSHVAMFFDPDTRRFAIGPTTSDDPDGHTVRIQGTDQKPTNARVISAVAFMNSVGFDPDRGRGRSIVEHAKEEKLLIFTPKQEGFDDEEGDEGRS